MIELMVAVAIVGLLAALAIPAYQSYLTRAASVDGYLQFAAVKTRITEFYAAETTLPATFEEMGLPPATGEAFGGDAASYEDIFGMESDVWGGVEYQPKPPHGYVFVLRSIREPDIGLHFQIKVDGSTVRVRCTVNERSERFPYVPTQCRTAGDVTDWDW